MQNYEGPNKIVRAAYDASEPEFSGSFESVPLQSAGISLFLQLT
jgi:hypothetical protein